MPPPRRFAVVGCGGAGRHHVDALARAGHAPTALIDPDAGRRAELGRPWPGTLLAATVDEALDAFDVAVVAAPDRTHPTLAVDLLRAGKDVLVEKPMAATRADAEVMVAAAADSGRVLAVGQVRRHLGVIRWAHDVLRSGVLGAVQRVDAAQGGRDDWIASSGGYVEDAFGGVVADQGAHTFDLLTWWFGPMAVRSCIDDGRGGREAEAVVELVAGATPVHVELSRIRSKRNTICVVAERGVLEVALDHYQPRQLVALPDGLGIEPFTGGADDLATQFDRQVVAFAEALDGRWPPTLATAADATAVAEVLEGCATCRTADEPWWMRSAATAP